MRDSPRWLRWTWILFLLTMLASIAIIANGRFDPGAGYVERWSSTLGDLAIPAGSTDLLWTGREVPDSCFSIRLSATYRSGEIDVGYGLAMGDRERHLVVELSPTGYVTIQKRHAGSAGPSAVAHDVILPWQTWPHIRTGEAMNEIWLDLAEDRLVTVRINRELLWEGYVDVEPREIGVIGQSFGEASMVSLREVRLFEAGSARECTRP